MSRFEWLQRLVAVAVLATLVGCEAQQAGNSGVGSAPELAPALPSETGYVPPAAPAAAPDDPVAAVKSALDSVQKGKLEHAYDFLPASYQKDIDQLVQSFAGKMDGEIWSAAFTVLHKAVDVLKTKKDMVLTLIPQQGPNGAGPSDQLSQNWDGLVHSLDLVVSSDVSDLERLKKVSTRTYLATTGNKFFTHLQTLSAAAGGQNPLDELKNTSVELVSRDGSQAVLKIKGPKDEDGQEQPFVQVEGRWIPQSLADEWADNMQKFRDQLDKITPEQIAAQKSQALAQLRSVEDTLDGMLAAQKPEDFQAAVFPLILQFSMLSQQFQSTAAPAGKVTIVVERELTEQEESRLLEHLVQLTDNPERSAYTSSKSDGRTRIVLDNVKSVVSFAEKLTFASSKSVDGGTRTITIELKPE